MRVLAVVFTVYMNMVITKFFGLGVWPYRRANCEAIALQGTDI